MRCCNHAPMSWAVSSEGCARAGANSYLLNDVIRSSAGFNRSDVVVGTDCGAINNMVRANHYASSDLDAAAKTLNGGCDILLFH